ncbi:MAG: ParA family protein [Pseudomonadota bacterium]
MSFVVTIAQRKGGSGKSTLACQLTAALLADGLTVLGVDTDEQASFSEWALRRMDRGDDDGRFAVETVAGYGVASTIRRGERFADVIIVDTAPSLDTTVKQAIRAADLVLTPMQLSPLDLEATMPTARLIGDVRKEPLFVINRAPPRARIADMIRAEIKRHGLPLAPAELGNRAAFSESLASGRGVVETAPSSRAAEEMRALAAVVTKRLDAVSAAA